jgi:hypothetical protein
VAELAELSEPVSMLVSPANLEFALRQAMKSRRDTTLRPRVNAICVRLHETGLPKDIPAEVEAEA